MDSLARRSSSGSQFSVLLLLLRELEPSAMALVQMAKKYDPLTLVVVLLPSFLAVAFPSASQSDWPELITDCMMLLLVAWIVKFVTCWPAQWAQQLGMERAQVFATVNSMYIAFLPNGQDLANARLILGHLLLARKLGRLQLWAWTVQLACILLGAALMLWTRNNVLVVPVRQEMVFSNVNIGVFVAWGLFKLVLLGAAGMEQYTNPLALELDFISDSNLDTQIESFEKPRRPPMTTREKRLSMELDSLKLELSQLKTSVNLNAQHLMELNAKTQSKLDRLPEKYAEAEASVLPFPLLPRFKLRPFKTLLGALDSLISSEPRVKTPKEKPKATPRHKPLQLPIDIKSEKSRLREESYTLKELRQRLISKLIERHGQPLRRLPLAHDPEPEDIKLLARAISFGLLTLTKYIAVSATQLVLAAALKTAGSGIWIVSMWAKVHYKAAAFAFRTVFFLPKLAVKAALGPPKTLIRQTH